MQINHHKILLYFYFLVWQKMTKMKLLISSVAELWEKGLLSYTSGGNGKMIPDFEGQFDRIHEVV